MREAWRQNIPRMWAERGVEIPDGESPATLIKTPENAQYFAALGAIEFGKDEDDAAGRYAGTARSGALHHGGPPRGTGRIRQPGPGRHARRARDIPSSNTRPDPSSRPRSSEGRPSARLPASTADPPPPRPSSCRQTATCSARPTSSRTATRFRTRSTSSARFAARWRRRAPRSTCSVWRRPAMRRTC